MINLDQLLNDALRASLQGLEEERIAALARRRRNLMITAAIGLPIVGVVHVLAGGDAALFTAFFVFTVGLGVYKYANSGFEKTFKDKLGNVLLQRIDESLTLTPEAGIMEREFRASRLFQKRPDRYRTEDLVAGTFGQTEVRFADVHAQDERRGQNNKKRHVDIFRGVLFVADFHKHFAQSVILRTDRAEAMFGGLGRALQRGSVGDAQRITLEDPEFENLFAVYAHDETEARYLLTPNMMRRFVELSGRVGPFSASFHEEQLYIAIPRERGLFEVDMDRSVLDLAAVREVVEDVYLFRGLVEALDLNTRIWTKE